MSRLNELIAQEIAEWEQLSGKKKTQELVSRAGLLDVYTRRLIIIGGIVVAVFPEVLQFQPQETEAGNDAEFAKLQAFLALLAGDVEYINQLKAKVDEAFR